MTVFEAGGHLCGTGSQLGSAADRGTRCPIPQPRLCTHILNAVHGPKLILGLLAVVVIGLLAAPVLHIPVRVAKDWNEGWVAYQADRAWEGPSLYPSGNVYISNNYPPLSAYVIGAFGRIVGGNIIAGRLIAFAAFITVAFTIGWILRRIGQTWTAAMAAVVIFTGYMVCYHETYLAMNDPHWLGQALMMIGMAVFIARRRNVIMLLAALLVMMTATMVKHSIVAFPAAATLWLLLVERRRFFTWTILGVTALSGFMLLWYLLYDSAFFSNLFLTPRTYAIGLIPPKLIDWMPPLLPFMTVGLLAIVLDFQNPYTRLFAIYSVISLVWALYVLGGAGIDKNIFFDLVIALILLCGISIDRCAAVFRHLWPAHSVRLVIVLLMALSVGIAIPSGLLAVKRSLGLAQKESLVQEEVSYISSFASPVACEDLALCYWAGKPFEIDFFNFGQYLNSSNTALDEFNHRIENHHYTLIQTNRPYGSYRWPPLVNQQLHRYYRGIELNPTNHAFFTPKSVQ